LEILANVNKQVLKELESRAELPANNQLVGDIFQQMADYFKMYKVFCTAQERSLAKVDQLTKANSKFAHFIKEAKEDPRSRSLNLVSFLIKPVQRICKYPLLLRELIKNTSSEHPDYAVLLDAKGRIDRVVDVVNDGKRIFESQQKVLEIQSMVDGISDLLAPSRFLVKEGNLLFSAQPDKLPIEHRIFLFNDVILFTKKKDKILLTMSFSKEYQLKGMTDLENARVILCADSSVHKNAFQIQSFGKTYTLSAKTYSESQDWFKNIQKLVKEFQLRKLKGSSLKGIYK